MAKDQELTGRILGDLRPVSTGHKVRAHDETIDDKVEMDESMEGGSQHAESRHSGSRDLTEGVTGGLGTD